MLILHAGLQPLGCSDKAVLEACMRHFIKDGHPAPGPAPRTCRVNR